MGRAHRLWRRPTFETPLKQQHAQAFDIEYNKEGRIKPGFTTPQHLPTGLRKNVEQAVIQKRKDREEEDMEKETYYDNAPPSGIAALKLARAKMRKIDKAYREKLESLLKGETEAQG